MFPVAHGWLLGRLIEHPTPAEFLGCVWPDMLFGSPVIHSQAHNSGAELLAFARGMPAGAERDEFTGFVRGVITHGSQPHGFDWFSDEGYGENPQAKGYAFQRAAPLAGRAAEACDVPPDSGLWKAHNMIEMAFERSLMQENIEAAHALAAACADERLMARIAAPLGHYFGHSPDALAESMARYASYVSLAPTSLDDLAQMYALQTRFKHPGAQPDAVALAALIGEAENIITADREEYLGVCLDGVRAIITACGL